MGGGIGYAEGVYEGALLEGQTQDLRNCSSLRNTSTFGNLGKGIEIFSHPSQKH